MDGYTTAVLVPCYNEALTIKQVVEDFRTHMPLAEIYVYDNNSTDGTAEIAREAGATVRREYKQGKGNVVRSMFRDIDADCYIMADGDDTYPASFAPKLEELVLSGRAGMAVGDRLSSTYFTENKRPFHNGGNVVVRRLINFIYGCKLNDILTGARAFSREYAKSFPVTAKGFEIETEMTIFALDNNFSIAEIPVGYRDRPEGSESKLNTYTDGVKVISTIGRLFCDTKPFTFFCVISAIFILIGLIFFIPVFAEFLETGLVLRMPTLLFVVGMWIIAVLNFFCGTVLSVLRRQQRQSFERHLTLLRELWKIQNSGQK